MGKLSVLNSTFYGNSLGSTTEGGWNQLASRAAQDLEAGVKGIYGPGTPIPGVPIGGGTTMRGIGPVGLQCSTLTMVHTATRALPGSFRGGRLWMEA